ncbi:hypothetical protein CR513_52935, partial [Mucuna pruriens]
MMTELYEQFKIRHHNSTPYHPKMNEAVEAANKNIKKIVQKMVVTYKDWHDMLPYMLHGYRTSIQTSIGATPYSLVYGTEAVLPIEIEIPPCESWPRSKVDGSMPWVAVPKENQECFRQENKTSYVQRGGFSTQENAAQLLRSKGEVDPKL